MNIHSPLIDNYINKFNIETNAINSSKNIDNLNSFDQKLFSEVLNSLVEIGSTIGNVTYEDDNEFLYEGLNTPLTTYRSNNTNIISSYNPINQLQAYKNNMYSNTALSNNNLKEKFKDDLFLGDSITKGLKSYNMLTDEQICAKVGNTTKQVSKMVDNLPSSKNPNRIFIMCGVNDVGSLSPQQFSENYSELIKKVKDKFPNSQIYIQAVLPVSHTSERDKVYLSNSKINEYNSELTKISKDENVGFINTASIVKGNEYYHEQDGIHFKSSFYPVWLNYLYNIG